jgi:hypothetical protein
MIIEIYDKNGEYVKGVIGDEAQCLANVAEDETYEEVQELRSHSLHNESAYLKSLKLGLVNEIKVTVNDKVFDGNEVSQDRIMRAINVALITGKDTALWRLADNTEVEVTLDEFREALSLASQEMSRIWLEA